MRTTFSHDEAEEILTHAVRKQAEAGGFIMPDEEASAHTVTEEQLVRMASELGISLQALQSAQQEMAAQREEQIEQREYSRHVRNEWQGHLASYAIVNTFLMLMDYFTSGHITWSIFPLLGWGIGLAFDTVSTFNRSDEDYQKGFEKWRAKRRKRQE